MGMVIICTLFQLSIVKNRHSMIHAQEFHTMVAPIKIKIIFKPFVRLNYWFIFKKIDMPILFYSLKVVKCTFSCWLIMCFVLIIIILMLELTGHYLCQYCRCNAGRKFIIFDFNIYTINSFL
jgi:hypothetical protein